MTRVLRRLAGSVRVRVTVTALLAVACAFTVALVLLDDALQRNGQRFLMATAEEQAREIVAFNPHLTTQVVLPPDATINSGLIQVLDSRGNVIGSSRALRYYPPLWRRGEPGIQRTSDPLGDLAKDVRVVAVPESVGSTKATVVVVMSLAQYDHSVAEVEGLLEKIAPILLLLVGVISWLIVGRALRPIEAMRREVDEVASVRGGYRVAEPAVMDEVGRLARTLNSMLDRIEASSERERRFVSDASHELRSPIANIRTEIEVALHHPQTADWSDVASGVLAENQRMERLVAGLLLLARSDEGSLIEASEPTDLAEVVASLAARVPPTGPDVRTATQTALVAVPYVYAERMVANLLDNARRFASTVIEVTTTVAGETVTLAVRNDGPGVALGDRERIFERFVRLDEARDRGEGGFGLGLAIVADLSRFYGGSIEVTDVSPGAEFVLHLPAWPTAAASPGPPAAPPLQPTALPRPPIPAR